MSQYGFRDGVMNVRALKTQQKRFKEDLIFRPYSSAIAFGAALDLSSATITNAGISIGTQIDYSRNLRFLNAMNAEAERRLQMTVKGYDGQGSYQEEVFNLSSAAVGTTVGSKAFAYVTEIQSSGGTGNYGTYGTVGLYGNYKFGISEFCDGASDGLGVCLATIGTKTVATTNMHSALFDVTNQTVNLTAKVDGNYEAIGIRYLSKFQKRHGDAN